jgi:hypothetical protein
MTLARQLGRIKPKTERIGTYADSEKPQMQQAGNAEPHAELRDDSRGHEQCVRAQVLYRSNTRLAR